MSDVSAPAVLPTEEEALCPYCDRTYKIDSEMTPRHYNKDGWAISWLCKECNKTKKQLRIMKVSFQGDDRKAFFQDAQGKSSSDIQNLAKERTSQIKTKVETKESGTAGKFMTEWQMSQEPRFIACPQEAINIRKNGAKKYCEIAEVWMYQVPEYLLSTSEKEQDKFEQEETAHGEKRLKAQAKAKKAPKTKPGDAGSKMKRLPAALLKKVRAKVVATEDRLHRAKRAAVLYDDERIKMYVPPHVMQKLTVVDLELKKYMDQLTATEQSGDKDAAAKTLKDMVETEGEHTVSLDSVEGPSALSHAARANVSNKYWHSEKAFSSAWVLVLRPKSYR